MIVWEDFLDALSPTRLQDEYNRAIRECDLFVMLFRTKVGRYTETTPAVPAATGINPTTATTTKGFRVVLRSPMFFRPFFWSRLEVGWRRPG